MRVAQVADILPHALRRRAAGKPCTAAGDRVIVRVMATLLLAGASSALGRAVGRLAAERGWAVRAMVRDPARVPADLARLIEGVAIADARDRSAVARAVAGADAVFSCVGASVLPVLGRGWRGFGAVDWPCNRNLVDAARAASVGRFVYVSVFHDAALRRLAYVDAHERVVEHLRAVGQPFGVVRPTGFFSAISSYVDLARRGKIPEIGGGRARTNPIGDADLAEVCVEALASADPASTIDCGGPEVMTRREIGEAAFAAIGAPPRFRAVPAAGVRAAMVVGRAFHPRIAQFMKFLAAISTRDLIAPPRGRARLVDAFAAHAA
jgi:uncharacterized protein YbjT (DUF2867 family)